MSRDNLPDMYRLLPDRAIHFCHELAELSHQLMTHRESNTAAAVRRAADALPQAGQAGRIGAASGQGSRGNDASASGQGEALGQAGGVGSASGQGSGEHVASASGQREASGSTGYRNPVLNNLRRQLEQQLTTHHNNAIVELITWQHPQREMEQDDVLRARKELLHAYEAYNTAMQSYNDLLEGHSAQIEEMMQLHARMLMFLGEPSLLLILQRNIRQQISASEPPLMRLQTLRECVHEMETVRAIVRNIAPMQVAIPNDSTSNRDRRRSRERSRRPRRQQQQR